MNCFCRYRDTLPRPQSDFATVSEIDKQRSLHDQKQFVGMRMIMPRIIALNDSESQAMIIYLIQHDVPILLLNGGGFGYDIQPFERRISHRLGLIIAGLR